MKKLLYQFDTDTLPSVFDNVVGYDGGAVHYFCSWNLAALLESAGFSVVQTKGTHYRPRVFGDLPSRLPLVSSFFREFFAGEIMLEALRL